MKRIHKIEQGNALRRISRIQQQPIKSMRRSDCLGLSAYTLKSAKKLKYVRHDNPLLLHPYRRWTNKENKANAFTPNVAVGQDAAPVLAPTRSNPNTSPVVTSPQPLRPLARRASGHVPQPRNRSPSTSNPLQDLAHQGS